MKIDRSWTHEEDVYLLKNYRSYGDAEKLRPELQMRSKAAIIKRANSLGLSTRRKPGDPYTLSELKSNCKLALSGCWVWQGDTRPKGYGVVIHAGVRISAHRLAYALATGKQIDDKLILHHCDNPPCINPDHLYAGTYTDNNRDTVKRGRYKNQYGPIKHI